MPATACGLFALHVGLIIKLHRGIVRCKKKLSDIDLWPFSLKGLDDPLIDSWNRSSGGHLNLIKLQSQIALINT